MTVVLILMGLSGYGIYLLVLNVDGKQSNFILVFHIFYIEQLHYTEWSECSKTCGNGTMFRNVTCLSSQDKSCNQSKVESLIEPCNTEQCPSGWRTEDLSECGCYGVKKRYFKSF